MNMAEALALAAIATPEAASPTRAGVGGPSWGLLRGVVQEVSDAGPVVVSIAANADVEGTAVACDLLQSVGPLGAGMHVLLALVGGPACRPIVLGVICAAPPPAVPDDLRLEARRSVTLQCGDASIALQEDGMVVVRGGDVVVRAKGTHRVRAGSVSIN